MTRSDPSFMNALETDRGREMHQRVFGNRGLDPEASNGGNMNVNAEIVALRKIQAHGARHVPKNRDADAEWFLHRKKNRDRTSWQNMRFDQHFERDGFTSPSCL